MKVLVTGSSSLIGRHVVKHLVVRGDSVICFQRRPSGLDADEVLGDLRDLDAVRRAGRNVDAVIHLAALVAPRMAYRDAYAVNVDGTRHVMSVAADAGRFVHISSPSVAFVDRAVIGGHAARANYVGRDVYARTKALAEQMVVASPTVPTVVLRPHLVWGPGDTQLVGRLIDRAQRGSLVLPDHGRALVDATYIDDAASAIVAGLGQAISGSDTLVGPFVVTSDDPRPVRDLVCGIVRAAGLDAHLRSVPSPLAGLAGHVVDALWRGPEPPLTHFAVRQLCVAHTFDQRETQRALNWKPTVGVDDGLARLETWFREQHDPPTARPESQ